VHGLRSPADLKKVPLRHGAMVPVSLVLLLAGCSFFTGRPSTVAPAATLYETGERLLLQDKN
jgi:hypothetical protein